MKNSLMKCIPMWDKVKTGAKFTGTIEGNFCEGRIYVKEIDGKVAAYYLCQNQKDGSDSPDKLGYENSWDIGTGLENELEQNDVVIHSLEEDPDFVPPIICMVGDYQVKFREGHILVGCQEITNEQVIEVVKHLKWSKDNG